MITRNTPGLFITLQLSPGCRIFKTHKSLGQGLSAVISVYVEWPRLGKMEINEPPLSEQITIYMSHKKFVTVIAGYSG